jgi:FAD/FMN-containing dehydrogenase
VAGAARSQFKQIETSHFNSLTSASTDREATTWAFPLASTGRRVFSSIDASCRSQARAKLDRISSSGTGSFLAVLKRCGDIPSPGLLSFPMEGTSLALDFPQHEMRNSSLFGALDTIVREAGGRIYPAKDAHMSGADFRAAYPRWQQLESLRDPAMLSHFWKRMTGL